MRSSSESLSVVKWPKVQKRKIGKWCGEIKEEISNERKDAKAQESRERK
jgi:hypothetical protein